MVVVGWIKTIYLSRASVTRLPFKALSEVSSSRFSSLLIYKTDSAWFEVSSWQKCCPQVITNILFCHLFMWRSGYLAILLSTDFEIVVAWNMCLLLCLCFSLPSMSCVMSHIPLPHTKRIFVCVWEGGGECYVIRRMSVLHALPTQLIDALSDKGLLFVPLWRI
jgi:hypothetical protein